jgi:hypothetical protein
MHPTWRVLAASFAAARGVFSFGLSAHSRKLTTCVVNRGVGGLGTPQRVTSSTPGLGVRNLGRFDVTRLPSRGFA